MRKWLRWQSAVRAGAMLIVLGGPAAAAALAPLYQLCPQGGCNRSYTNADLLQDSSGNIFGVTDYEGSHGHGNIYKLSYNSKKSRWTYSDLYDFCSAKNCTDGDLPDAAVIVDTSGNLYGTTAKGGTTNHGVAFELMPDHQLRVLYNFCADGGSCPDGSSPTGALTYAGAETGSPYDGQSPLYGVAQTTAGAGGIVYELSLNGSNWVGKSVYSFGTQNGASCYSDAVVMDGSGDLFGTTRYCGDYGDGTAFVIGHSKKGWASIAHYSFGGGFVPRGPLVKDEKGNLYGVTEDGGTGLGNIFKLSPIVDTFTEKTLHTFSDQDGAWPEGGLVMDSAGNFFGTTYGEGAHQGGNVFELSGKTFGVLYSFCGNGKCAGGARPSAGVILGKTGNLFGWTTLEGKYGAGSVFELTP